MSADAIRISNHALVRWLERTGLAEIDPLKALLARSLERAARAANTLQSSHYIILADGLVYVVRGGVLVTVLTEDDPHSHVRAMQYRQEEQAGG